MASPSPVPSMKHVFLYPNQIVANPFQPRKRFDEAALLELKNSIQFMGLLQSPSVRLNPNDPNTFQLIAGERRVRAIRLINDDPNTDNFGPIKCELKEVDDKTLLEMALEENLRRRQLDPLEEAGAYAQLEQWGMSQEEIGERFGLHSSTVSNTLRLLKLPEPVRAFLVNDQLSRGHGVALCALNDDPPACLAFAEKAAAGGWTQKALEDEIRAFRAEKKEEQQPGLLDETVPAAQMAGAPMVDVAAGAVTAPVEAEPAAPETDDSEPAAAEPTEAAEDTPRPALVDVTRPGLVDVNATPADVYDSAPVTATVPASVLAQIAEGCDPVAEMKDEGATFEHSGARFYCARFSKSGETILSATCYRVVPLDSYDGQTVRYAELLTRWEAEGAKDDRTGWKFREGEDFYVVIDGPITFTAPDAEKAPAPKPAKAPKATPAATSKDQYKLGDFVQYEVKKRQWQTGKIADVGRTLYWVQPTGSGDDAKKRKEFKKENCPLQPWDGQSPAGPVKAVEPPKPTPEAAKPAPAAAPAAAPPKAVAGMTITYAPTDAVFACEDAGLTTAELYKSALRLIALASDRSITVDEYLTALETADQGEDKMAVTMAVADEASANPAVPTEETETP